jgi:alpha-glucosidase (family GH31 glycosyl hydrolase)
VAQEVRKTGRERRGSQYLRFEVFMATRYCTYSAARGVLNYWNVQRLLLTPLLPRIALEVVARRTGSWFWRVVLLTSFSHFLYSQASGSILKSPGVERPFSTMAPMTAGGADNMRIIEEEGLTRYLLETRDGGEVKVTIYDSSVVRIQWHWIHPYEKDEVALASGYDWTGGNREVKHWESEDCFHIKTEKVETRISKSDPLRIDFHCSKTGQLICGDHSIEFNPSYDPRFDDTYENIRERGRLPRGFKVKNTKIADKSSGFFGLGDWAGPINRRGHRIQFWNDDSFNWRDLHSPKYTSFPIVYNVTQRAAGGAMVYAVFFNNTSRTMFDLGASDETRYSFEGADGQVDYFFMLGGGQDFADIVTKISRLTGKGTFLPKWAYGYQLSRFTYTQKDTASVLGGFHNINTPLSAIYIDLDYMDQSPSPFDKEFRLVQLQWNPFWFPDPRGMIKNLAKDGVQTVVMIEPFLDMVDDKYDYAEGSGYFVKDVNGKTQVTDIWCAERASWIDFTNPEAATWWKREVTKFVSLYGIRGIWNDLNETADVGKIRLDGLYNLGGRFPDSADSRRWHLNVKNVHNIYSTKVSYEALAEAWPDSRPFVLGRGGFPGTQRYATVWSGDNRADEASLSSNIRAGVSIAICGLSNYGHDIGGFSGTPTFEVFQRWHEWSVFIPLMRNHSGRPNPSREPYLYAYHERMSLIDTIRQRYYFLPHVYSLARKAHLNGTPFNSPVVAMFPNSEGAFHQNDSDFMVGENIMVCPVVGSGERSRRVKFPAGSGQWYYFWDDNVTGAGGEEVLVDAPLGRSPLFVRAGGIVAVNPDGLSRKAPAANNIAFLNTEFHLWPGRGNSFVFFDDNGESPLDRPDDTRCVVDIRHETYGDHQVVKLMPSGNIGSRKFKVVFRGDDFRGRKFTVNGVKATPVLKRGSGTGRWTGAAIDVDLSKGGAVIGVDP